MAAAATVARFAGHLGGLLAAAAERPDEPFSDLPLLTPEEHAELVVTWNDTRAGSAGGGATGGGVSRQFPLPSYQAKAKVPVKQKTSGPS